MLNPMCKSSLGPYKHVMAKRILLVDDSAMVRAALRAMLEDEIGWAVCGEAVDGRQAIAQALEFKPHLIVLDLSMPVMNGLDAAQELKKRLPSVVMVMFTSFDQSHVHQLALSAGISKVVPKSAPDTLYRTVHALLDEAAA